MSRLRTVLLMSLAYMASGFLNIIGGIQLRNTNHKFAMVSATKMCNINVTDIFDKLTQNRPNRRDMGKAIFVTGLSTAIITAEPHIKQANAKENVAEDTWTQHSGKFSEDEIKDFVQTKSGLLYKDIETGKGQTSKDGELVTLEMVGYIFETGEKWCNTYKGIPTYKSVIRAGPRENQKFM